MNNRKILSVISIFLILSLSLCFFSCTSKPSEKTFKEVQRASVEEFVEEFNKGYDNMQKVDYTDTSIKTDISISLSDEVLKMLRSSVGEDMTWLNDVNISMLQSYKGEMASVNLGLNYKTSSLLSLGAIMNISSGDAYIALPELTSKMLKLETGDAGVATVYDPTKNLAAELMPDKEAIGRIILKYYDIIMASLTDVAFTDGTLTVGDLSTDCTVYTVTLTRAQVNALALNILESIKTDEDIITYVKEVDAYAAENELSEESIYDEFVISIDEAIEEIKTDDDADGALEAFKWTSYFTKKNEILANSFELYGDEETVSFFAGRVQNKENIAVQSYLKTNGEAAFEIEGKLTEVKGKQTGTFELMSEGKSMLFIDVKDVDIKKLEDDGLVSGSFTICPSKGLIDMITEDMDSEESTNLLPGLAIASFSIKLDVDQKSAEKAELTISVLNSGAPYVSATVSSEISKGQSTTLPSENNVVVSAEEWLVGMDFDAFLEKLEASGLPSFVIELAEQYIMMLQYGYSPY